MWNDKTDALKNRIINLSNEELLQMVNLDYEQYRKEALDHARAEMDKRGLKIEPVSFTAAPPAEAEAEIPYSEYSESATETSDSEYSEPTAAIEEEAERASVVEFKMFSGMWATWEQLFSDAAAFATEIGPLKLIGISHSSANERVVTVWYWT